MELNKQGVLKTWHFATSRQTKVIVMYFQIIRNDCGTSLIIKKLLKNGTFIFAFFDSRLKFIRPSDRNEWENAVENWRGWVENASLKKDPFPIMIKVGKQLYAYYRKSKFLKIFKKEKKPDYFFYKAEARLEVSANLRKTFKIIAEKDKAVTDYYIDRFGIDSAEKLTEIFYISVDDKKDNYREVISERPTEYIYKM